MGRWRSVTIGDVCQLVNGGTPKTKIAEYWGGPHAWITPAEMGGRSSPYISDSRRSLSDDGLAKCSASLLPSRSVILSSRAPIGHLVINEVPMATNQGCKGLVPSDELNHKFLYYYLFSIVLLLNDLGSGTTFKELSATKLKGVPVPLPPLPEQERIVAILDEAFAAIATATANAEMNLANARELFESELNCVFSQKGDGWVETKLGDEVDLSAGFAFKSNGYTDSPNSVLLLRGDNIIQGKLRWNGVKRWPRTSAEEYSQFYLQENDVVLAMDRPWVAAGLKVAFLTANDLPCLQVQRTARLQTRQNLNWKYLFHMLCSTSFIDYILGGQTGLGVPHISGKQILAFRFLLPSTTEQKAIVKKIDALSDETKSLEAIHRRKLDALAELKQSILHKAFTGELTANIPLPVVIPFPATIENISTTDLHASILAMSYRAHEAEDRLGDFGHVKGEKIAHMVEAYAGVELGRKPLKDAAGPNDYPHLKKVEHRAKMAGFFSVQRRGERYQVTPLPGFGRLIERASEALGDHLEQVENLIALMLPMDTKQSEIFATVYAAWNNLLLDGREPVDEAIVRAAREDWHPTKIKISPDRFMKAIKWFRDNDLVPKGAGKKVRDKEAVA